MTNPIIHVPNTKDVKAKYPYTDLSISMPESVVKGATNHEIGNGRPIWALFIITMMEMFLWTSIILISVATIGYVADAIRPAVILGFLASAAVGLLIWKSHSIVNKLIISGDYATIREIESRERVQTLIVREQAELSKKGMDLEWERMKKDAEIQIQGILTNNHLRDTQEQLRLAKMRTTEYDLHRQASWTDKKDEVPIRDTVLRLMQRWIGEVYAEDHPIYDQPWSKNGRDWDQEHKDFVTNNVMPVIRTLEDPLFEISRKTGHRAIFNKSMYRESDAYEFIKEIWETL